MHFLKTGGEIYSAIILALCQRSVCYMVDDSLLLVDVADLGISDIARIRGLSSLLGEKGRFVEDNVIAAVGGNRLKHRRNEGVGVGVYIVKLLGFI